MILAKSSSRLSNVMKTTPFRSSSFHSKNSWENKCIYLFRDIRNVDDAVTVFDKMLQMKPMPPLIEFSTFFGIVVRMNHFDQVILMYKELRLLDRQIDVFLMTIAANCYCKLRQLDSAFAIMATSIRMGYPPDSHIVSALIKGLFAQGMVPQAAALFERVVEYDLCKVDVFIYSTVLDGLCKSGRLVDAVQLLGDLEYVYGTLNTSGYNGVINGLCKSRKVDDAMDLFSKMIRRGYRPNIVTYTVLIQGLCNYSRMDEAKELLRQMIDRKVYPNVQIFNALLNSYCKDGAIEDAEHVVQHMEDWDVQPSVVTYNTLMNGYCLLGQLDKAMAVLNLIVNKGLEPSVISYAIIIRGYCVHRQFDHAWKLFNEMPYKGLTPSVSVYNTIIQGLESEGRGSEALELYNEMKIVCRTWEDTV